MKCPKCDHLITPDYIKDAWRSAVQTEILDHLIELAKYYAEKNGKNSKAAVLLREMGIEE